VAPSSADHSGRIARVVPLLRLHHLGDRRFDYLVPESLAPAVARGAIVTVPFGRRTVRAVVMETGPQAEVPGEGLKAVQEVAPDRVSGELLDLAQALAERYLCSLESDEQRPARIMWRGCSIRIRRWSPD
jgi:primosomal protein N' (replication factor Y)